MSIRLIDIAQHLFAESKDFHGIGRQFRNKRRVGFQMQGHFAHAIDDIVEFIGQLHGIWNVEAHDERVVEQLMDLFDDTIGLVFDFDNALGISALGRPEKRGAVERGAGQVFEEFDQPVAARRSKQGTDRETC